MTSSIDCLSYMSDVIDLMFRWLEFDEEQDNVLNVLLPKPMQNVNLYNH